MLLFGRGKEVVENQDSISIFELNKCSESWERNLQFVGPRIFKLGNTRARLINDPHWHDWYLELQEPWEGCDNTAITIVKTPCHYGGYREWFECPKCNKRAGILYRAEDEFKCRKCLNLNYQSQKQNYRTIAPIIRRWRKFEDMKRPRSYNFYKGKITKRAKRYWEQREKVEFGMNFLADKFAYEA